MKHMKINQKTFVKQLKELKEKQKRGAVSLSLNLALWERFKAECDKHGESASAVTENLMRAFLGENLGE